MPTALAITEFASSPPTSLLDPSLDKAAPAALGNIARRPQRFERRFLFRIYTGFLELSGNSGRAKRMDLLLVASDDLAVGLWA